MEDQESVDIPSSFQEGIPRRRELDTSRQVHTVSPPQPDSPKKKRKSTTKILAVCLMIFGFIITFKAFSRPVDPAVLHARFLLEMEHQPSAKTINVYDQTKPYSEGGEVDGIEKAITVFKMQQANLSVDLCAIAFAHFDSTDTRECWLWSRNGVHTTSYVDLVEGEPYYLFLKNRLFLWPTVKVGFRQASTVKGTTGLPIELETLSLRPRIFRIYNYITAADVQMFIDLSRQVTMSRSTGGLRKKGTNAGDEISTRTSENAWDTDSKHAKMLKNLAMDLLRIPHHDADFLDGFQIVRYHPGQSYITHSDFFSLDSGRGWNWDPATGGVNRWATLFLYLSNVTLGGETMFPSAGDMPPTDNTTVEEVEALKKQLFKPDAWENNIVDECRSKFRVVPAVGEAILFYHQSSTGQLDNMAQHAACPVLIGEKLGANLWIWNDKRWSMERAEKGEQTEEEEVNQGNKPFLASFINRRGPVDVFWLGSKAMFQFASDKGETVTRNTYKGHEFVVRDRDGTEVQRLVMDPKATHTYEILA